MIVVLKTKGPQTLDNIPLSPGENDLSDEQYGRVIKSIWGSYLIENGLLVLSDGGKISTGEEKDPVGVSAKPKKGKKIRVV